MLNNQDSNTHTSRKVVLPYTMPKLHTGKQWYVDFSCLDPLTQTMRRKKYMLDHIKGVRSRRIYAAELIAALTYKLRQGWNVWASEDSDSRHYVSLEAALDLYCRNLLKQKNAGSLRERTWHTYMSYYRTWRSWLDGLPHKIYYVYQMDKPLIIDFLDYVFYDKEVSARTRNNYKGWLFTLCEWFIGKGYTSLNPADGIKSLREDTKKRNALSPTMLSQLRTHLERIDDRHFLLACLLEYYCFIRPKELTYLQIGDIKLKEQKITISGSFSKNHRDEAVGLNSEVINLMLDLDIFSHSPDWFLFGRKFTPSPKQTSPRIFPERFQKLREELCWPDCYQFYSLKDSGIRDLANEKGIVIARDQARHLDVSTTNRYLKSDAGHVHDETKTFVGNL